MLSSQESYWGWLGFNVSKDNGPKAQTHPNIIISIFCLLIRVITPDLSDALKVLNTINGVQNSSIRLILDILNFSSFFEKAHFSYVSKTLNGVCIFFFLYELSLLGIPGIAFGFSWLRIPNSLFDTKILNSSVWKKPLLALWISKLPTFGMLNGDRAFQILHVGDNNWILITFATK